MAKKTDKLKLAKRSVAIDGGVLDHLYAVVLDRKGGDTATSHSARLLSRGTAKIAQKFGEEAVECLIEAVARNPATVVTESADVLYHLMVLWVDAGIAPDAVWAELTRRQGTSGIAEKAARTVKNGSPAIVAPAQKRRETRPRSRKIP